MKSEGNCDFFVNVCVILLQFIGSLNKTFYQFSLHFLNKTFYCLLQKTKLILKNLKPTQKVEKMPFKVLFYIPFQLLRHRPNCRRLSQAS